ncbi:MAG TPA: hypothetical protein DCZ95_12325 [Verrucomicrobia bacterium]|nr:MAG: hypothetical protein A2X46_14370 [Lentisphaerae bacterium GWF2_57_35]HBA84871.1 hypothetical protein [Verrucomicrobiota bacterium]
MEHPLAIKKELSPEEKIAVLIASLDQAVSASILQQLEPRVMVKVVNAIKKLGVVPGPVRDKAIAECLSEIREMGHAVQGDESMVTTLLNQAVGEKKAAAMLSENRTEEGGEAFAGMAQMGPEQIAGLISKEQAGVIALVLRHLPSSLSSEVMEVLPSETRRRVIVFMCTAETPSEEVVSRVEAHLSAKTGPTKKKKASEGDKLDAVTGIIQHAKSSVEEDLLAAIEEKSEVLANAIRDRLFTFEDIVKLSDVAMRRVMQEIDMGVLAIALRNGNAELKDKFFGNMSKRAAEGLKEEMDYAQKVRLTDVEAKQREIVNTVRALAGQGQISIGSEDEYV